MKAVELVRTYIDRVWNERNFEAFAEMTTEDFTYTIGGRPPKSGPEFTQFVDMAHRSFPDWHIKIDTIFTDGDYVAACWHGTATHKGNFHGIAPTNKAVRLSGTNVYRLEGGRIKTEHEQMDTLGLLMQLGVALG